jgi:hypothetical protein
MDHDNRNVRGRRLRSGDVQVIGCHDDFDVTANEVSDVTSVHVLHDNVLAFHPTEPTQALFPRLDLVRDTPPSHLADPPNCRRRLRLGGERRGEEAARHGADEHPPVHHSIT